MPTITRWLIRAGILCLLAGLFIALVVAFPRFSDVAAAWRPAWIHLLVMGWATQLIFGVSIWMFPRRKPLNVTSIDWLGWSCFAGTNLGLLLRVIAEPALALGSWSPAGTVLLVAALLQLLAVVSYVMLVWNRVAAR